MSSGSSAGSNMQDPFEIEDKFEPVNSVQDFDLSSGNKAATAIVNDAEDAAQKIDKLHRLEQLSQEYAELTDRKGQVLQNNCPPFCQCCPCRPCLHFSIDVDIPTESRCLIRLAYSLWIGNGVVILFHVGVTLAWLIKEPKGCLAFGLSLAWLCLYLMFSFICWFWPLYIAFRDNRVVHLILYFLATVIQIGFNMFLCTGFEFISGGFMSGIFVLPQLKVVGPLLLTTASLFLLCSLVYLSISIWITLIKTCYKKPTSAWTAVN